LLCLILVSTLYTFLFSESICRAGVSRLAWRLHWYSIHRFTVVSSLTRSGRRGQPLSLTHLARWAWQAVTVRGCTRFVIISADRAFRSCKCPLETVISCGTLVTGAIPLIRVWFGGFTQAKIPSFAITRVCGEIIALTILSCIAGCYLFAPQRTVIARCAGINLII
jgi:hypothetical protein